ncbi:MAG: choice-of-anchor B family protein, partial [Bacteroidetes bacterium]
MTINLIPFGMRPVRLIVWGLLMLSAAGLRAQASKNVSLISQLSFPVELNDVWGWADSSGREYGLVGRTNGVSIVDLANPAQPVVLHDIPGVTSVWRDLKTWGHHAYVTNETGNGLLIIDLSGLPGSVSYVDTVLAGVTTAHNAWVDEDGYLYLCGTNNYNGGVAIYDLNPDPGLPAFVGAYDQRYVHDLFVRGQRAYLGEILDGRLTILDVSDRSAPLVIGSQTYPGGFTHNTWLNDAGDICFTTDELNEGYLIAWDVSDPEDIREQDRIRSSLSQGRAAPHNVHVLNDFLVTSYYRDGLHIVDAARPGNLVEVAYYDTSPLAGGGLAGAWGAYPFLPSGRVLVTDMQEGFFVLDVAYRRGAYLEGQVTDGQTGAPVGQVDLRVLGVEGGETRSQTSGAYALGVADSGSYQLVAQLYGYETDTLTVDLLPGQLTTQDIVLQPLPRIDLEVVVREAGSLDPIPGVTVAALVPDTTVGFTFTTGFDGRVIANRFVINTYSVQVGKWGYQT